MTHVGRHKRPETVMPVVTLPAWSAKHREDKMKEGSWALKILQAENSLMGIVPVNVSCPSGTQKNDPKGNSLGPGDRDVDTEGEALSHGLFPGLENEWSFPGGILELLGTDDSFL